MIRLYSLAAVLCLSACATAGVKVDQSKMNAFEKGKTTYQDVVQSLGRPTQSIVTDTGDQMIYYSYFSAQARPESFIPYVGAFVGGADMENSLVSFTFDKAGILRSYTHSQGSTGAGRNLEGYSQPRNEDQPRQVK